MSTPDVYVKIGALMPLLASSNDAQVGRALTQMDNALHEAKMTWAQFGAKVATLGAKPLDPRRVANGAASAAAGQTAPTTPAGRLPSQWKIDCADIARLMDQPLDEWTETFVASLHDWTSQGRGLSPRQREILHEKLDQHGL